jgi:hypothetical protein
VLIQSFNGKAKALLHFTHAYGSPLNEHDQDKVESTRRHAIGHGFVGLPVLKNLKCQEICRAFDFGSNKGDFHRTSCSNDQSKLTNRKLSV